MATKKELDAYPQSIFIEVKQDAANSDKVEQVPTSFSTRDRMGMLLLECNVYANASGGFEVDPLVATGDSINFGLSHLYAGGSVRTVTLNEGLIFLQSIARVDAGTPADTFLSQSPFRYVPREPVLCHPASLFCFLDSANLGSVATVYFEIIYKYMTLTDQMWQDMWESILIKDRL